jgi:hypothetical protein
LRAVVDPLRTCASGAAKHLEQIENHLLAYTALPNDTLVETSLNKPIERSNQDLKQLADITDQPVAPSLPAAPRT